MVENILVSLVCRDCLATASPAREPLALGWWAWLREFLSFDTIWELFAAVAPRVLPLSWAKVISELRWSSYLTNTEGMKRSCQNPRLPSYKIKHSFLFRVRMKSKRTLHGVTIWWESGESDPCLQLYPYQDSEERHHRGEAARLRPPWRQRTHASTYLSSIHKKYQLVRVGNGRHRVDGKTENAKVKSMPHWQMYLSRDTRAVPEKSRPVAQPNTGELYSHVASPACLAHGGLATLGSIRFSLWHERAKHSCGCLKSETGFSTLGLEAGASLWEVTFK